MANYESIFCIGDVRVRPIRCRLIRSSRSHFCSPPNGKAAKRALASSTVSLIIFSLARSVKDTKGDEGCDETRRRADPKRPARAEVVGAPSDDRGSDRSAAE